MHDGFRLALDRAGMSTPCFTGSRLGPGKLLLVVGPSGAGKDTLIKQARRICQSDPRVVFPRRVVTRSSATGEDHESIGEQEFERRASADAFALSWRAHGLSYGVSRSINDLIVRGDTVVCNVSRTIVARARSQYEHVIVVLVTAPPDILAQRLADRGRETAGSIATRLARAEHADQDLRPDIIIDNIGPPEQGAQPLVEAIYQMSRPIGP